MRLAIVIFSIAYSQLARTQDTNDWQEMELKGTPKSVSIVYDRDINMCAPLIQGSLTYVFDENGYETKRLYVWRLEKRDSVGKYHSFFDSLRFANTFANGCRVAKVRFAHSADTNDKRTYEYNDQKQLIRRIRKDPGEQHFVFGEYEYRYEYDKDKQLIREFQFDRRGKSLDTITYKYDNGNLTEMAVMDHGPWKVYSYKYDTHGLLTETIEVIYHYSSDTTNWHIIGADTIITAYQYPSIDKSENWLERITYRNGMPSRYERREINYYSHK